MGCLSLVQPFLGLSALQACLVAATIAGDDGVIRGAGEGVAIGPGHEGKEAAEKQIWYLAKVKRRQLWSMPLS